MKKGNIIGEPFDNYVKEQIFLRQKIYGAGIDKTSRNPEYLQYMNGRGSWIKMASSVSINPDISINISDRDVNQSNKTHLLVAAQSSNFATKEKNYISGEQKLKDIGLNPNEFAGTLLAEKAILFGGLVYSDFLSEIGQTQISFSNLPSSDPSIENARSGRDIIVAGVGDRKRIVKISSINKFKGNILRQGVSNSSEIWNDGFAYGLGGNDYGLNPMPGITSLSIENLNRGSIRKASVHIRAHNKFQFELIELLYIRLGFNMLLEWGTNEYPYNMNESGDIQFQQMVNTLIEKEWFSNNGFSYYDILEKIENLREEYRGNYDGFFGKVVNFDWSFNTDGSYDITLDLVSVGDVIESLKVNILSDPINPKSSNANENLNDITNYLITLTSHEEIWQNSDAKNNFPFVFLSLSTLKNDIFEGKHNTLKIKIPGQKSKPNTKIISNHYFIRFGEFLNFLEKNIVPYIENEGGKPFPLFKIDTDIDKNRMPIFLNQFSIDPRICVIKTKYSNIKELKEFEFGDMANFYSSDKVNHGKIMNIYLNFSFIDKILQESLNQKQDLNFYEFIEKILNGINKSFGNISNLEMIINENQNTLKIIDQNTFPGKELFYPSGSFNFEPLEIFGYNKISDQSNFVKDFSFNTKITPQLSTQLTIGATANNAVVGEESTAFSHWNEGLTDRYNQYIANPGIQVKLKTKDQNKKSFPFFKVFTTLITRGFFTLRKQEKEKKVKIKTTYSDYIRRAFGKNKKEEENQYYNYKPLFIAEGYNNLKNSFTNPENKEDKPTQTSVGFIPLSINIKLDGISGIKIYNSLQINTKFLPNNYPKVMEFIIIKVNHKLENNEWTTELETISIPKLEKPTIIQDKTIPTPTSSILTPNADRLRKVIKETNNIEKKGKPLSNGGDITFSTADMGIAVIRKIKSLYPNIILRFTSGNDIFHQNYTDSLSRHKDGRALDFTVEPSNSETINQVLEIIQGFTAGNNGNFRYLNEYEKSTTNTIGKHFHISWGQGTEGKDNLQKSIALFNNNLIQSYIV